MIIFKKLNKTNKIDKLESEIKQRREAEDEAEKAAYAEEQARLEAEAAAAAQALEDERLAALAETITISRDATIDMSVLAAEPVQKTEE